MTGIRPHLLVVLLLVAVTVAAYGAILGHEFIPGWDDDLYVTANPAAHGLTPDHLRRACTGIFVGNYAPLQIVSYMFDYEVWGLQPAGYLLTNLLLHLANGLLWYGLIFRVTRHRLWAAVAAGLFLWHPLQVESVAWVSQRKTVLSLFFFLGAFHCYVSAEGRPTGRRFLLAASLGCFVLALLAKSVAVVLPLVLISYDVCFRPEKGWRAILLDKAAYAGAAAACVMAALVSQGDYGAGGGRFPYFGGSFLVTMVTMVPVYARYLQLILVPFGQSAVYAPPLKRVPDADVVLAALLLVLLGLAAILLWRRRRDLAFWPALAVIGFLPAAQIVPLITLMNDRYCYYPLLGVGGLAGALAVWAADNRSRLRLALPAGLLLAGYGIALPLMAHARSAIWRDPPTLWRDTYAKTPVVFTGYDPDMVRDKLAEAYTREARRRHLAGEYAAARQAYLAALAVDPLAHDALNDYAVLLLDQERPHAARRYLETMIRAFPRSYRGYLNLGDCLIMTGEHAAAEAAYARAASLSPGNPKIAVARGRAAESRRDLAAAARFYGEAVAIGTEDPAILVRLAALDLRRGDRTAARDRLAEALRRGFREGEILAADPQLVALRSDAGCRQLLTAAGISVP